MYYKLTRPDGTSYGGCQWGVGVSHETDGSGDLCGPGWIHFYSSPLLAVLLNPIHGSYNLATAHLWEVEGSGTIKEDHGLKFGAMTVTTIRRLDIPEVSLTQKIAFGIISSLTVYHDASYATWAEDWLSGKDRSPAAARAAMDAARAAVAAAMDAARAAEGATWEENVEEVEVEWAAAWAAAKAAKTKSWASKRCLAWSPPLDLGTLAQLAMEVTP